MSKTDPTLTRIAAQFVGGVPVIYGVTANNNPTVQDVWNTAPAWSVPYYTSSLAPAPAWATILDGAFGMHVAGFGGYLFIDDRLYLEASVYRTLDFRIQNNLGTNPFGAPGMIDGGAPYLRAAYEETIGPHSLMVGGYFFQVDVRPWFINTGLYDPATNSALERSTVGPYDRYTDVSVDTQYQFKGDNYWLTLRGIYVHEQHRLTASFLNGFSGNPSNTLNTARAQASLAYGGDNRIVVTGQYFNTWGSTDTTTYNYNPTFDPNYPLSGRPNSSGWVGEVNYIPFMDSKAPVWPWFNVRLGLQYTAYTEFNGYRSHASDNNTLYLYALLSRPATRSARSRASR